MAKSHTPQIKQKPSFIEGIRPAFLLLIILLVSIIVFFSGLKNSYTNFDDTIIVFGNSLVTNLSFTNLPKFFLSFNNGMYHPITSLAFGLQYRIFGDSAAGYHVVSLMLHLLNTIMVFWLIWLIKPNNLIAVLTAALFALHPMHTESVYWISEQKGLLSALFLLSGLISYILFTRRRDSKYYKYAFILFVFSVLSKPSGIIFLPLIILWDYYLNKRVNIISKMPFALISLFIIIVSIIAANSVEGINSFLNYNVFDRIVIIAFAPLKYIIGAIVPLSLSAKDFFPVKTGGMLPYTYIVGAFVFILLLFIWYKRRRNNHDINFGLLFFLISISVLLPILSVGDSLVSARHSYISYIGLFFIASNLFYAAIRKFKKLTPLIWSLLFIYLIVISIVSNKRAGVWANSVTLWTDIVKKNPGSAFAYSNLGDSYADIMKYDIAESQYSKAIEIDSTFALAYMNRGYIRLKSKSYEAALLDLNAAVRLNSQFSKVYYNRSCLFIETKQWEKAIADADMAIKLNPDFAASYYNRAVAHNYLSENSLALNDIEKAISLDKSNALFYLSKGRICVSLNDSTGAAQAFGQSEMLSPDNAENLFQTGLSYFKAKRFTKAESYFNKVLLLSDSFVQAYFYRAMTNEALNNNAGAISDYNLCLKTDSAFAPAYYAKGLLLIKINRTAEACDAFSSAVNYGFSAASAEITKYCK